MSVQARSFADMLETTLRRYQNRAIEAAPGHRGTDRPRPRNARGQRPRRAAGTLGGRTGLLRRAGNQRQRRPGPRRRKPSATSPASSWTPSATTSPSTGPSAKTSAPTSAAWSAAPSANTATRPTSRNRPPKQSSNKPKSSPKAGPPPDRRLSPIPASVARTASTASTDCIASIDVIASTHHPQPPSASRPQQPNTRPRHSLPDSPSPRPLLSPLTTLPSLLLHRTHIPPKWTHPPRN